MSGGDPTTRDKQVSHLADLPGGDRGQLNAIATGIDDETQDSGPGHLLIGVPRPQAALAVDHGGRRYVEGGVLIEPGTTGRYESQARPIPATGRSSWVTQVGQRGGEGSRGGTVARDGHHADRGPGFGQRSPARTIVGPRGEPLVAIDQPADAAPWSHLLRVIDGHLCLVLFDPLEHSAADRADLPGGGFCAAIVGDTRIRTRLGDVLAPMVYGEPTHPEVAPREGDPAAGTVARDRADEASEALAGTTARHHSDDGQRDTVGGGDRKDDRKEDTRITSDEQADRILNAPLSEASEELADRARIFLSTGTDPGPRRGRGGRRAPAPSPSTPPQAAPGWRLVDGSAGLYEGPDGRRYRIDLASGTMVAEGGGGSSGGPGTIVVGLPGAPRPTGDPNTIVLGLGRRPSRGAILSREVTPEQAAAVDREVEALEERLRSQGLTPAEAARLNALRSQRAGQATVTLGLGGRNLEGVDANGNRVIFVGLAQGQRTLNASVSGIAPRATPGAAAADEAARRSLADRLQRELDAVRAELQHLGVDLDAAGGVALSGPASSNFVGRAQGGGGATGAPPSVGRRR